MWLMTVKYHETWIILAASYMLEEKFQKKHKIWASHPTTRMWSSFCAWWISIYHSLLSIFTRKYHKRWKVVTYSIYSCAYSYELPTFAGCYHLFNYFTCHDFFGLWAVVMAVSSTFQILFGPKLNLCKWLDKCWKKLFSLCLLNALARDKLVASGTLSDSSLCRCINP